MRRFGQSVPSTTAYNLLNMHNVQYAGLCAFCSVSVLRNALVKMSSVVGRIWVIFVQYVCVNYVNTCLMCQC